MSLPFLMAVCPTCQRPVAAMEDRSVSYYDGEGLPCRFKLMCCSACPQAFVVLQELYAGQHWGQPELMWPSATKALNQAIPFKIRKELSEATQCFKAGQYTATAVMVRRVIEGVCRSHNATGTPFKALDDLYERGLIDKRLLEWAHGLRALGNDGAHFGGKPITRQDAEDALTLAEAVLNYMYVFTRQYEEFKQRRAESVPPSDEGTSNGSAPTCELGPVSK
ncbi:DUF4145 domain-containing protein [Microbispora bryophytorum]|uniref:DUF4145 domain-containing protein n=1 Tax=Microbispora bryophytorum TaxID=1460882 RepID=A0A8H9GXB9_9ACTN|nr:DUF4145 domain-containing protein [Microbispora bryophytorum]MBD3139622.1 DUF4145 domain-containing protein [Microbispora bryophytorum]TQS02907.1 DUF4145 domain-containing protein [Microbispora bryophytorum]GGO02988.1 hypothetical protein GCM10011574_12340 [Microbispora bryophytorum]